jgi:hypothetical protein
MAPYSRYHFIGMMSETGAILHVCCAHRATGLCAPGRKGRAAEWLNYSHSRDCIKIKKFLHFFEYAYIINHTKVDKSVRISIIFIFFKKSVICKKYYRISKSN